MEITRPPDSIYAGHELIFAVNSQNSNQQYWNFGDGAVSTERAGTHKYQKAGDYKFMSIVNGNCQNIFNVIVIADTATVPPEIIVAGGPPFYLGDAIEFQANASSSDTLQWDFGDGNTLKSNSRDISHIYKSEKVYEVKVKDIRSNKVDSYSIRIEKRPMNYDTSPRITATTTTKAKKKSNPNLNIESVIIVDSLPHHENKINIEPVLRKLPFAFTKKDIKNMILAMANDPDGVNDKGGFYNFNDNYKRLKSICDNSNIPVKTAKYKAETLTLESYSQKLKTFKRDNTILLVFKNQYKISSIDFDTNDLGFITWLTIVD